MTADTGSSVEGRQQRNARLTMVYVRRALRLAVRHPVEAYDVARNRAEFLRAREQHPDPARDVDPNWTATLHSRIGTGGACSENEAFERVWSDLERLADATGVPAGSGYDGDTTLARATWCAIRHLGAERVVETGVGRGATSHVILQALRVSGRAGRLWSVDLPPFEEPWQSQVGVLVPGDLRGSWEYRRGPSRRLLRPLLEEVGPIEVFLHDSLHTPENIAFEIRSAWPHLTTPGIAILDDVADVSFLRRLAAELAGAELIVADHVEKPGVVGILIKSEEQRDKHPDVERTASD